MRYEKVPEKLLDDFDNNYFSFTKNHGWTNLSIEFSQTIDDILRIIDSNIKPYGLEIVILDHPDLEELCFYKVKPISLLDATKYYVEKGIII